MNWPSIFLGCFVIGFLLSVLSLALSATHVHLHVHWPFGHHAAAGNLHRGVGPVNFATGTAFVAWFGGAGYLLTSNFGWLLAPALAAAIVAGLVGASIVFWMMARVLWSPDENMQSADYHMVGVLGQLSQAIRPGGVGELVYVQGGTRKSCGARSADGSAIGKGTDVVVTEYDRGIAQVRRWSDLAAADEQGAR